MQHEVESRSLGQPKSRIIVRIAGRAQSLQRGSNTATVVDRLNGGQSVFKEIAGPLTRGALFRGREKIDRDREVRGRQRIAR